MSRIRVLHIHHGRVLGGAPISLSRLIEHLPKDRFESHVVVPGSGPAADYFRARGIVLHELALSAWYYLAHQPRVKLSTRLKHGVMSPITRRALSRLIDQVRPDLIHLNCALLPVPAGVARARGVPFVFHIREVVPDNDPRARDYLVEASRPAAARVAISEAAARPFRVAGDVRVIHEGVDPGEWHRPELREPSRAALGLNAADIVVLYPAGLGRHKGQMEFLDALPAARAREPRLVVLFAGGEVEGGRLPALMNHAARLGLYRTGSETNPVRWLGWRSDLPALLAAADLAAFLPTAPEGFGLPLVESMAAGKAIVAPDDSTGREIVEDGVTGRCIPAGDARTLADALVELAGDAALRDRLGHAARGVVAERFTIEGMSQAFIEVFESAVRSGPAGGSRP